MRFTTDPQKVKLTLDQIPLGHVIEIKGSDSVWLKTAEECWPVVCLGSKPGLDGCKAGFLGSPVSSAIVTADHGLLYLEP